MTEPAAGWYHDPADAGAWRWWDGTAWTDHVRAKEEAPPSAPIPVVVEPVPTHPPVFETAPEPEPAPGPQPAPAPEPTAESEAAPPVSGIPQPGQVAAGPPAPPAPIPSYASTPVTDQMYWHSSAAEVIEVPRLNHGSTGAIRLPNAPVPSYVRDWNDLGSPNTAGIWLLAALPLMSFPIGFVLGMVFGFAGVPAQVGNAVLAGLLLGLQWIFASFDQRALAQRGYHPPSIWWMLLFPPLAYFIARGKSVRRESMRAWPPELLYVGTLFLMLAVALFAAYTMGLTSLPS